MESVKLFYCVKLCDETDCFEKHIRKVHKIQDHIMECFKAHVIRDRYFGYCFWNEATVSGATHVQYLDLDGFIRIVSLNSKDALPINKVDNFRLLSFWVPRGSVVRCLTRNPGVLGSSLTRSSGFFSWECPWARHFRA